MQVDVKKVSFVSVVMCNTACYVGWTPCYISKHVHVHTQTHRQTHTLTQTECLSIHGSWQNRFSQACKSTWIPTPLQLDALMRHWLRPVSTSPDAPSHGGVDSHVVREADIIPECLRNGRIKDDGTWTDTCSWDLFSREASTTVKLQCVKLPKQWRWWRNYQFISWLRLIFWIWIDLIRLPALLQSATRGECNIFQIYIDCNQLKCLLVLEYTWLV